MRLLRWSLHSRALLGPTVSGLRIVALVWALSRITSCLLWLARIRLLLMHSLLGILAIGLAVHRRRRLCESLTNLGLLLLWLLWIWILSSGRRGG